MHQYKMVCEQAARSAGEVLRQWSDRFEVREKAPADLVTEADVAAQEKIRAHLLEHFPEHGFLGEEGQSCDPINCGYRWIVDPLDGTTNYVHGVPYYCVSIALEHDGQLLVGTVYDPTADLCYTAVAGKGATCNGEPLRVRPTTEIGDAMVAGSLSARITADSPEIRDFVAVLTHCRATRRMGSAALNLCMIAAGKFDAYFATNNKAWDIAAGVLLVQEAGGIVTSLDGGPLDLAHPRFVASATPQLHDQLLGLLAGSTA